MLKLLILFPLLLAGGAIAFALALPVFALLPVALAVGAGFFVLFAAVGMAGLLLRLVAVLFLACGGLLIFALGFGFVFAGGALVLALGLALSHLLVPLLLIAAIVWLIRRASRSPTSLPAAQP